MKLCLNDNKNKKKQHFFGKNNIQCFKYILQIKETHVKKLKNSKN